MKQYNYDSRESKIKKAFSHLKKNPVLAFAVLTGILAVTVPSVNMIIGDQTGSSAFTAQQGDKVTCWREQGSGNIGKYTDCHVGRTFKSEDAGRVDDNKYRLVETKGPKIIDQVYYKTYYYIKKTSSDTNKNKTDSWSRHYDAMANADKNKNKNKTDSWSRHYDAMANADKNKNKTDSWSRHYDAMANADKNKKQSHAQSNLMHYTCWRLRENGQNINTKAAELRSCVKWNAKASDGGINPQYYTYNNTVGPITKNNVVYKTYYYDKKSSKSESTYQSKEQNPKTLYKTCWRVTDNGNPINDNKYLITSAGDNGCMDSEKYNYSKSNGHLSSNEYKFNITIGPKKYGNTVYITHYYDKVEKQDEEFIEEINQAEDQLEVAQQETKEAEIEVEEKKEELKEAKQEVNKLKEEIKTESNHIKKQEKQKEIEKAEENKEEKQKAVIESTLRANTAKENLQQAKENYIVKAGYEQPKDIDELAKTGPAETFSAIMAVGSITAAVWYYVSSKRRLM